MKTILDQQIELELGDNYDEALDRARRFVSATLNMYSRWGKTQTILNNEGGRTGVLRNCLATIIEVGEINDGLDRWANRLAKEYANGSHTKWASYDMLRIDLNEEHLLVDEGTGAPIPQDKRGIDVRPMIGYSTLGYTPQVLTPEGDDLVSLLGEPSLESVETDSTSGGGRDDHLLDKVIKTDEELELYKAIAATNNLGDAANLIGMDIEHARRLNHRVWQRARRTRGNRGFRLSATN